MSGLVIQFEGETYEWTGKVMVSEMSAIQHHTGKNYVGWLQAIEEGDPASLQSLLWLLKKHKLQPCDLRTLDFDMAAFIGAIGEAYSQRAEVEAEDTPDPKGAKGARTPG